MRDLAAVLKEKGDVHEADMLYHMIPRGPPVLYAGSFSNRLRSWERRILTAWVPCTRWLVPCTSRAS